MTCSVCKKHLSRSNRAYKRGVHWRCQGDPRPPCAFCGSPLYSRDHRYPRDDPRAYDADRLHGQCRRFVARPAELRARAAELLAEAAIAEQLVAQNRLPLRLPS